MLQRKRYFKHRYLLNWYLTLKVTLLMVHTLLKCQNCMNSMSPLQEVGILKSINKINNCQNDAVPTLLKSFVSMLLNGNSIKHEDPVESQACFSVDLLPC